MQKLRQGFLQNFGHEKTPTLKSLRVTRKNEKTPTVKSLRITQKFKIVRE